MQINTILKLGTGAVAGIFIGMCVTEDTKTRLITKMKKRLIFALTGEKWEPKKPVVGQTDYTTYSGYYKNRANTNQKTDCNKMREEFRFNEDSIKDGKFAWEKEAGIFEEDYDKKIREPKDEAGEKKDISGGGWRKALHFKEKEAADEFYIDLICMAENQGKITLYDICEFRGMLTDDSDDEELAYWYFDEEDVKLAKVEIKPITDDDPTGYRITLDEMRPKDLYRWG